MEPCHLYCSPQFVLRQDSSVKIVLKHAKNVNLGKSVDSVLKGHIVSITSEKCSEFRRSLLVFVMNLWDRLICKGAQTLQGKQL